MIDTPYPRFTPVGEDALLVEYAAQINLEINRQVRQLNFALDHAKIPGVTEVIPAYRSLMVYFDAGRVALPDLQAAIVACERQSHAVELPSPQIFRLPTVYGGRFGPDLQHVAAATGQSPEAVIKQFSTRQYPVYCLGFLCSLPYLGEIPPSLHVPRRATPRTAVPAGSVGIAAGQAVVLPIDMPSGFHYLGRTFVSLYDPTQMPPTRIRAGDLIEFPAVDEPSLGDGLTE